MGNVTIKLEMPIDIDGKLREEIVLETPLRLRHLKGIDFAKCQGFDMVQHIAENMAGWPQESMEPLSVNDFTKVIDAINPWLEAFNRLTRAGMS